MHLNPHDGFLEGSRSTAASCGEKEESIRGMGAARACRQPQCQAGDGGREEVSPTPLQPQKPEGDVPISLYHHPLDKPGGPWIPASRADPQP